MKTQRRQTERQKERKKERKKAVGLMAQGAPPQEKVDKLKG